MYHLICQMSGNISRFHLKEAPVNASDVGLPLVTKYLSLITPSNKDTDISV